MVYEQAPEPVTSQRHGRQAIDSLGGLKNTLKH
jgi:hypothetical protein